MNLRPYQEDLVQVIHEHARVLIVWKMGLGAMEAILKEVPLTKDSLVIAPKWIHRIYYKNLPCPIVTPQYAKLHFDELIKAYDYCVVSHVCNLEKRNSETFRALRTIATKAKRAVWYTNFDHPHKVEGFFRPGYFDLPSRIYPKISDRLRSPEWFKHTCHYSEGEYHAPI